MTKRIKKVSIVGGTHGNELNGVCLVKYIQKNLNKHKDLNYALDAWIANELAVKRGVRYIDEDLNRCFEKGVVSSVDKVNQERAIAASLFKKHVCEDEKIDFLIDLHTTTANMGITVFLSKTDSLTRLAASFLQHEFPEIKLAETSVLDDLAPYLSSIAKSGLLIEVGPVAPSTLDARLYFKTKQVVDALLNFFDVINEELLEERYPNLLQKKPLVIYKAKKFIDYPRDSNGNITAMIHPDRLGKDYEAINEGDSLFLDFDGNTIIYQEPELSYPIFIGEAAYYEKEIAMYLTEKKEVVFDASNMCL
jgi:succinylglutamate desuccinylase